MSADEAVGPPERLHPFFLLTGLGSSLRGMLGAYAGAAYVAANGWLGTALTSILGLLLFVAISLYIHWRRFEFRVGQDEIRIDSGVFSRTHRSIPFDRIQDVDISQGPVARLLGLARVKFETGGSAGAGNDEGVLHAIALERAQQIRTLVRAHRAPATAAAAEEVRIERGESPPLYAMDLRRLLLAGVFSFSLALFGGLIGATQTFGDVIGFDPFERSFWRSAAARGGPFAEYLMAHRAAAAVGGAAVLVLIGIATGIVRSALRDYGFRLDRSERGLRRRRGLLTRTDVTLPLRRVQAAIVATGPVRERFGWRELKLQSLAHDEGKERDHQAAPLATDTEIDRLLAALGFRPLDGGGAWKPVSRAYVLGLAAVLSPFLVLALVQIVFVPVAGAAAVAAILAAVATRWLAWRRTGYVLDEDRLVFRAGWWRRRTVILPKRRIQSIDLTESFVSRRFGIATLIFGVAGGSAISTHMIPALPRETARQLRHELLAVQP